MGRSASRAVSRARRLLDSPKAAKVDCLVAVLKTTGVNKGWTKALRDERGLRALTANDSALRQPMGCVVHVDSAVRGR